MTKPVPDNAAGVTEVSFFFLRASRTTETVTVRQLVRFILNRATEMSSFLDQNSTKWIFFPPKGHMLLSLCYVVLLVQAIFSIPMAMAI